MSNVGLLEIPVALMGLLFYVVLFVCLWKFYEVLSKINDNLAGIRRAVTDKAFENRVKAPEE